MLWKIIQAEVEFWCTNYRAYWTMLSMYLLSLQLPVQFLAPVKSKTDLEMRQVIDK